MVQLKTSLQEVRAPLMRILGAKVLALGPLVPVEAAPSESVAADIEIWKVDGHKRRSLLIRHVPRIVGPERGPAG